jgi:predicted phosphoadenosine phosphosulfate sulfurtransferase
MTERTKRRIRQWVAAWEAKGYHDGLPDEAPMTLESSGRVPSYRMICQAILKNDEALLSLGFGREPCRIYNHLKRIELAARTVQPRLRPIQGELF